LSIASGFLVSITFLTFVAQPSFAHPGALDLVAGSPVLVTFDSWKFLNATVHDNFGTPLKLVLVAVWKNSIGQTVAVSTSGIGITLGETSNCYAPIFNVPPGGYTVTFFVVEATNNNPLSLAVSVPIYVSGS
jgi:hypothetical protein